MSNQRYISDSLKRKKQQIKKIKTYIIVALLILFVVAFVYVLRLPAISIQEIKINGNMFVETSEIEQKTNNILNKKILGLIPVRNIFIFPKRELIESLKQNPAIVSVDVRKKFFKTISIDIVEQEKEIIYCLNIERSDCYYVNKTGFIYAKVEDLIIPEQEIIIFNEKEIKNIKDNILDQKIYSDILLFVKNLARQEIKIKEVHIKQDSTIEFVSRTDTRIITSVFDEFEKDFAHLIALFDTNVLTKDQLPNIEYIDVRFGNKVFYKNKTN